MRETVSDFGSPQCLDTATHRVSVPLIGLFISSTLEVDSHHWMREWAELAI